MARGDMRVGMMFLFTKKQRRAVAHHYGEPGLASMELMASWLRLNSALVLAVLEEGVPTRKRKKPTP